jgi:hypothetical protein
LIEGENVDDDPAVVVVVDSVVVVVDDSVVVAVSVDVGAVSVEVEESVNVVPVSVDAGDVSAAVDVLSVDPESTNAIPKAPEAITPAQSRAPSPRTIPTRRKFFRPFMSPAPLSPQIRRIR